ncbi:phytanoyl-CoA dioxygenase [Pyrenophora tritici-repentis]|uniref:Phytanoyl-CoA dioxygenase n=2 Tax=Pyrenophora tritici-repentis TaxID=45151 RepID=A0A2W1DBV8_9PLEO|nr:phytanoyl-dioxygenase family protein [Pyrenophora tritici-repentis]KAF7443379.1 phytanoyl-dioxygenase family protein [Pyrenophora tritici-repentis]KAF7568130.1 phytanoyl-CoA dioxygenase [Pyrenophora tritici-repentis]KAG9376939.1 phytanoyl-dioxygenase family protein [Pyrenophora tritici-repentis]KAI0574215.1 phytanoyl-dioxygenase family protein [Pyrenophora tritici-repentis]
MQLASQFFTIQGAVAHTDMPIESGPTRLLPFSQKYEEGYIADRIPEFQDYFVNIYVSVPLAMGDGLFFNPALFHAAGQNNSADVMRSANLLQISSAFGRPMETIDTLPLIEITWEVISKMYEDDGLSAELEAFVSVVAQGYPFLTNLDRRIPNTAGMAPGSEQELLVSCVKAHSTEEHVLTQLKEIRENSRA